MSVLASLVDSNVWIALAFEAHPGHPSAAEAMAEVMRESTAVFCRATQQSFLRLTSTPALLRQYGADGLTNDDAIGLLDRFLAVPGIVYREEPAGVYALWRQLAGRPSAAPKVWMDANLAAFAIRGDLRFITLDRDFTGFESAGLKVHLLEVS